MIKEPSKTKVRKAKGEYHHGDLREALLTVASTLLERDGAEMITMRGLAAKVGVREAAPYHYFDGRPEVLAALAARGFDELKRRCEQAAMTNDDPGKAVRIIALLLSGWAYEKPAHFRLMFSADYELQSSAPVQKARRELVKLVRLAVASFIAHEKTSMPVDTAYRLFWVAATGVAWLGLDPVVNLGLTQGEAGALAAEAVAQWMNGTRGRSSKPRARVRGATGTKTDEHRTVS